MEYSNTSQKMKNLVRAAMEIAGRGQGLEGKNGSPVGDEIEATKITTETSETQNECVECETENNIEEITQHIIKLQKSLDFDMSEDAINFAVDLYLEQNIPGRDVGSDQPMRIPGRDVGNTDHNHVEGQRREDRGKLDQFMRNVQAGYVKGKIRQARTVVPEIRGSEVMKGIMRTAAERMQGDEFS